MSFCPGTRPTFGQVVLHLRSTIKPPILLCFNLGFQKWLHHLETDQSTRVTHWPQSDKVLHQVSLHCHLPFFSTVMRTAAGLRRRQLASFFQEVLRSLFCPTRVTTGPWLSPTNSGSIHKTLVIQEAGMLACPFSILLFSHQPANPLTVKASAALRAHRKKFMVGESPLHSLT